MSRFRITPPMRARVAEMVAQLHHTCEHTLLSVTVRVVRGDEVYVQMPGPGGRDTFAIDQVKLTRAEWTTVDPALWRAS